MDALVAEHDEQEDAEHRHQNDEQTPSQGRRRLLLDCQHPEECGRDDRKVEQRNRPGKAGPVENGKRELLEHD